MAPSSRQATTRQSSRANQGPRRQANGAPSRQVTSAAAGGPANVARQATNTSNIMVDDDSMDVDIVGPMVRIKTSDGKRFCLTEWEVSCSNTLRRMFEGSTGHQAASSSSEYVHLQNITSTILEEILVWCRHHCQPDQNKAKGGQVHLAAEGHNYGGADSDHSACRRAEKDASFELNDKDKTFMNLFSEEDLLELMHGCNFLDVQCLFNTCCRTIAKRWELKKVEEIRRMYGIHGDFGFDEESQMIQDNKRLGLNE